MPKYITRGRINTVKVSLPTQYAQAVPTTFLGMPALPIGGLGKNVATGIRGISVGRITVTPNTTSTTDAQGRVKRGGNRIARATSKRTKSNASSGGLIAKITRRKTNKARTVATGGKNKPHRANRSRSMGIKRNSNGRFTKK